MCEMWSLLVSSERSEYKHDFAAASPEENRDFIAIKYAQREYIYARKEKPEPR